MAYEVTGQVRVQAQVPWLQSALVLLREIIDLVQDLVDKVSGCGPLSYCHLVDPAYYSVNCLSIVRPTITSRDLQN